jgi:hypothetical protein
VLGGELTAPHRTTNSVASDLVKDENGGLDRQGEISGSHGDEYGDYYLQRQTNFFSGILFSSSTQ